MSRQERTRPERVAHQPARRAVRARGADRRRALRAVRSGAADTPLRVVSAAVSGVVVLVLVGLVVLLGVLPRATGGAALTVLTGSMQPTLRPGDVVVVRGVHTADVCDKVGVGDIVTFLPEPGDPSTITHRVVAKTVGTFDDGTSCRLVTQGDANNTADEPISPQQVRGIFWYGLPKLGWAKQWVVGNPTTVLGIVAAAAIVWWLLPRRRSTRVVTVPSGPASGTSGPASGPTPSPTSGPASTVLGAPTAVAPDDHVPSERELALREREVAVREAELALFRARITPAGAGRPPAGAGPGGR